MTPDTIAFFNVLVINFVDKVGVSFTTPVMVPFGRFIGATTKQIALFSTVRGLGGLIANVWMPRFSDRNGRKLVLLLAIFGRAVAYFIQGSAASFGEATIAVFVTGRIIAGLFAGSIPVIQAYITEISGDKDLISQRMVSSSVASQVAEIALQPISGVLAKTHIQLPFLACGAVGMCGFIYTGCMFKDSSQVKEQLRLSQQRPSASPQDPPQEQLREEEEKSPLYDTVILMCFVGWFSIVVCVVCFPFLTPILLNQDSFGLQRDTLEKTQGEIAMAQALVQMPAGLLQLFVSLFLYLPLSKRVGPVAIILVCGTLGSICEAAVGFCTNLTQLTWVFAAAGICFGFLIPLIGPLIARYSSVFYPKNLAFCQGIPMFGAAMASSFGQNIIAYAYDEENGKNMRLCWVILGVCVFIFTLALAFAAFLVERRLSKSPGVEQEDEKVSHAARQSITSQSMASEFALCTSSFNLEASSAKRRASSFVRRSIDEKRESLSSNTRDSALQLQSLGTRTL